MVAVVVGSRLGLEQTSGWVLGSRGLLGQAALGRNGENVFVNAATGNLVLTQRDEFLLGQGVDSTIMRSYNSQSDIDGDNNDGWRFMRTVSDANGAVTRTDWDGSVVTYTLIGTDLYRTTEGAGAYDTLRKVGATWVWTDGDTQQTENYETYAANQYRVVSRKDTDGQGLTFSYNTDGYLSQIATQTVGGRTDITDFIYGTGAAKANLLEVRTSYKDAVDALKIETRTRYAYDAQNRLVSVAVDLSPADGVITDGKAYVTTYTYDGASDRVASISQTDGSRIDITYEASGAFRVTRISQTVSGGVTRATNFNYVSSTRTDVTGPDGLVTILEYDAAGQLKKVTEPGAAAGVAGQVREFEYDLYGNVTLVKSAPNVWTEFEYLDADGVGASTDHNGLWTRQWVREGANGYLASERTYNARYAVLTETRFTGYDADGRGGPALATGALTTRYVYDSENHLAYTISPMGAVTKYDYHPNGNLVRTIAYTAARLNDVDTLGVREVPTLARMNTWVTEIADKTQAQIAEIVYDDHRGAIKTTYSYAEVLATTGGANGAGPKTTTQYVYDHRGRLTSRYVVGVPGVETFVYDGLNRVITKADFYGVTTTSAFYDALSTTVVTTADGLNRISVYNRAGEMVSQSETTRAPNLVNLNGWPTDTTSVPVGPASVNGWQNPNGMSTEASWSVVTGPDGRPVVAMHAGQSTDANTQGGGNQTNSTQIDPSKAYEFVYYFRKSDLTRHGLYFGLSPSATQAYVEGGGGWTDNANPYFYSASPAVQQTTYQADRWYKVVAYVLPVGTATIPADAVGGVYDMTTGAKVASTQTFRWNDPRPDNSVFSRFFLFNDNVGTANQVNTTYFLAPEMRQVDTSAAPAAAPATQYRYDVQGRLRLVVDETGAATHYLYDRVGRKVAEIDGDGSLTEYQYDVYDRPIATIRYATKVNLTSLTDAAGNPLPVELSAVRPTAHADDAWNWTVYDLAGRVVQTIDGAGATAAHTYDGLGRLTATTEYANVFGASAVASFKIAVARPPQALQLPSSSTADRITRYYHDADGRQVGVLDAEGYLSLTDYDKAGRVTHTRSFATRPTDATATFAAMRQQLEALGDTDDIRNWSVYDGRGFLRGTVGGEGEVTLYDYSPLGHLTQVIRGRKLAGVPDTQPTLATLTNAPTSPQTPSVLETTTYTRNAYGQALTEVRALAGGTETITCTYELGRLTATWTDRVANAGADSGTRHRYDRNGRLIAQLGGEGTAALMALGGSPSSTAVENVWRAWGVSFAYDDADRLISRTDPDGAGGAGRKTLYIYDADGNLAYEVGPLGHAVGYVYDALNRLTETITFGQPVAASVLALKGGLLKAGDGLPSLTSLTAADGRTVVRYNVTDTVKEIEQRLTATDSAITSFVYNAFGEVSKRVNDLGAVGSARTSDTTFTYDRRGQLTKTIDDALSGLMRTTQAVYDAFGRPIQTTDARNVVRDTEYDRAGRVLVHYDGDDKTTKYTYDARGNVLSVEDRTGAITRFAHDAFSRTVTTTLAEGGVITTTHDDRGQVLKVIDPDQRATTYVYDRDGRLKSTTRAPGTPSVGTATNDYDSAGQLYETVDAAGVRTRYTYDAAGRVLTRIVDPTVGGLNLTTSYAYFHDAAGARTRFTDASNVKVDYEFDLAGRQTRIVRDPDGLKLATTYTYDHAGNVTRVQELADTTVLRDTAYTYDKLGRRGTEQVEPASLNILTTYAYDLNDNVVSRTDKVDATTSVTSRFAYDAENRLTFTVDPTGAVSRNYHDAEGRVTRTVAYASRPTFAGNYVYSDQNLRATTDSAALAAQDRATEFVYDKEGRLTFTVDALGHLAQRIYFPSGALKQTIRYEGVVPGETSRTDDALEALVGQSSFQAQGMRLERSVYDDAGRLAYAIDAGGSVVSYAYDPAGKVLGETRYGAEYTAAGHPLLTEMDAWVTANSVAAKSTTRMVYDAAGRLAYSIDPLSSVTVYAYVGGQATGETRYGAPYTAAGQPTLSDMTDWVNANATASKLVTRTVYDAVGRLAYRIDAAGSVTAYAYDGVDQITAQTRYGALYTATGQPTRSDMTNEKGLSQEQLAFEAEMKRSYLSDLERGVRNPSIKAVERLAIALGVDPAVLFQR